MSPILALKKTVCVGYVTLFTLYCLMRVLFSIWFKPASQRARLNAQTTKLWGATLMRYLKVDIAFKGAPISSGPTLFVGNHMSYLDIPVFYSQRTATFVAKRQVARWPIFGAAAAAVGTVFVDRDSVKSRSKTTEAMRHAIIDRGLSIVIFPEGTSTLSGRPWRHGALKMAREADLLVQPFTIYYRPARDAAYIDDDSFIPHLWHWVVNIKIKAEIHFFEPRKITDAVKETAEIQKLVQDKWNELNAAQ